MDATTLLFALRIAGALLLLALMGGIAYLIYLDMQATIDALEDRNRIHGWLELIEAPPVESTNGEIADLSRRFPLMPVTTLGRSESNSVTLPDSYASGNHAVIDLRGSQWWLEDLGSRNGTLVNNIPVEEATIISSGDLITVGRARLLVNIGDV